MNDKILEEISDLLEDIKKLLVYKMLSGKKEVSSKDLGRVLGLDASSVRHMLSSKKRKK